MFGRGAAGRTGAVAAAALTLALAGCGGPGGSGAGARIQVLAAENFWGSIAAQLGGARVDVQSVVTDPNADPHEYESSTADARAFATAGYVILNGAGYDDWAARLLSANPSSDRRVLTVASFLGRKAGDNPHFWYDPAYVVAVADRITADLKAADPGDRAYFDRQRAAFGGALEPYQALLADIKQRFAGTPVGATESIFVYLAGYLGLDLVSPPELMRAVSDGIDPPAAAVAAFHDQISSRAIKVLVYNRQTATQVTSNLVTDAERQGIPVVGISETMQGTTFQAWQVTQLQALEKALGAGA